MGDDRLDGVGYCAECGKKLVGKKPRFCAKCGAEVPKVDGSDAELTPDEQAALSATVAQGTETRAAEPSSESEPLERNTESRAPEEMNPDGASESVASGGSTKADPLVGTNAPSPAGTYSDPFRVGESRYWDGSRWDYNARDYKWQAERVEAGVVDPPKGQALEPNAIRESRVAVSGAPALQAAKRRRRFEIGIGLAVGIAAVGVGIGWAAITSQSSNTSGAASATSQSLDLPPGLTIKGCQADGLRDGLIWIHVSASNTTSRYWDGSMTIDVIQKGEVIDSIEVEGRWAPSSDNFIPISDEIQARYPPFDVEPSCRVTSVSVS